MAEGRNIGTSKCCSCCCVNCNTSATATADVESLLEKQNCQDEEIRRLKKSYDEVVNRNQELEAKLLKMAEELMVERNKYQEGLLAMAEKLVDATETVNRMEREIIQNRKDCNLVVQLLKCHQSLDKNHVLKEVRKLSSDLQKKFCKELDLELPQDEGRRPQRSLSTSDLYSPPETEVPLKSILKKRSQSSVDTPVVANGHVTFKEDMPAYKKKGLWIFNRSKQVENNNAEKKNNATS